MWHYSRRRGHVRLLRREVRLREALGNHTWDHPDLTTLSAKAQAAQIDRATRSLIALIGVRPCLFRPPYGAFYRRHHYRFVVL
ncbi:MAG TPA: polysaccharide deacetylase family protein [Marmoricola sp.]|nr:polysaccharide deacetylase family protein [Marmoricola sp.]